MFGRKHFFFEKADGKIDWKNYYVIRRRIQMIRKITIVIEERNKEKMRMDEEGLVEKDWKYDRSKMENVLKEAGVAIRRGEI
jgi:hypothetical protein